MSAYVVAVFLSSFLVFLVQPLVGKYILPWFGGSPGVWTTCLLFFQLMLVADYNYAHVNNTAAKVAAGHCSSNGVGNIVAIFANDSVW